MKTKIEGKVTMADTTLETALINLFRNGGNMNISQTTAQLHTDKAMRLYGTVQVKAAMLKLEKDAILTRETIDGITRFRWNGIAKDGSGEMPTRKVFSKAGEPTSKRVAELIETMRLALFEEYGSDFAFSVIGRGKVIASSSANSTFHACTKEG